MATEASNVGRALRTPRAAAIAGIVFSVSAGMSQVLPFSGSLASCALALESERIGSSLHERQGSCYRKSADSHQPYDFPTMLKRFGHHRVSQHREHGPSRESLYPCPFHP